MDKENCYQSETDLFSKEALQTDVEEGFWDKIIPNTGFQNNNLVFDVPGTMEYVDLSETELYVQCSIRKRSNTSTEETATHIDDTDKIGAANNFLHTLFASASMSINEYPIENANGSYAYRAYIENLLTYSQSAKETHLRRAMFIKDTPGEFENFTTKPKPTVLTAESKEKDIVTYLLEKEKKYNEGYNKRRNAFVAQNKVEMMGPLHLDMMNVNKYLLNNTPFRITLMRSEPGFCLIGTKGTSNYHVSIDKAFLYVRKVRLSPSIMAIHLKGLQTMNCHYPVRRVVVNTYTFKPNLLNESINLYAGKMPRRIVLGFVDHSATANTFEKNPFNFTPCHVKKLQLSVAGHSVPFKEALEMDYDKNNYINGFSSIFKGINRSAYINGNGISYTDYKDGYALYAFNLTPDHCDGEYRSTPLTGQLALHVDFSKAQTNSITLVYYMEFDAMVSINNIRQVVSNYTV